MNLNQVTIPSVNVPASLAFYQQLGLRLIVNAAPRYIRFECPNGTSTLSVHRVPTLPQGEGIQVYFECDNLDDYVMELQQKGIVFEQLPTNQPWLWREASLKDPDNNRLILFYAGKNRKNPPWRV